MRRHVLCALVVLVGCGGQGKQGEIGERGLEGPRGVIGPTGPQGERGPPGLPGEPLTPGTRLYVPRIIYTGEDGSQYVKVADHFHDNVLNADCIIGDLYDGSVRCIPVAVVNPYYYADAACAGASVVMEMAGAALTAVRRFDADSKVHAYSLAEVSERYWLQGGVCALAPIPEGQVALALTELAPDDMVSFTQSSGWATP